MPQMTDLVINDGKATPAAHTFKPRGTPNGIATFVESSGVPIGDSRLTFAQTRNQNGRIRCTLKGTFPVVQDATVNGISRPTPVRTAYVDLTFNFDSSSATAERKDVVAMVKNALANTGLVVPWAVDLEEMF